MSGKLLWTVLRTGGPEYDYAKVFALARNAAKFGINLACVTDREPRVYQESASEPGTPPIFWAEAPPHLHYPGWWMKMALFAMVAEGAALRQDIVFCDLDTVITGPMNEIFAYQRSAILRDFFQGGAADGTSAVKYPDSSRVGSGFMRITPKLADLIWSEWSQYPEKWMREAGGYGDQYVIGEIAGDIFMRWQDVLPGKIISYKADMARHGNHSKVPEGVDVVCFHGQPRPWNLEQAWVIDARNPATQ